MLLSLIRLLFILLLEVKQFVPEQEQLLVLGGVFEGELLNHFLLVFDLFFELFDEAVVLCADTRDLSILLSDVVFKSCCVTVTRRAGTKVVRRFV